MLAKGRWRLVRAPATRVSVVVEPNRGIRQPEYAWVRWSPIDHQSLGTGLLPLVDVVERAHLPRRHPDVPQGREPVFGRGGRQDSLDLLNQCAADGTRFWLTSKRGSAGSMSRAVANARHRDSDPQATCTGAVAVWKSP